MCELPKEIHRKFRAQRPQEKEAHWRNLSQRSFNVKQESHEKFTVKQESTFVSATNAKQGAQVLVFILL